MSCVSRGGGLGRGLGGLVYALLRTGRATGCEELIAAAEALLTENGPTVAEHDRWTSSCTAAPASCSRRWRCTGSDPAPACSGWRTRPP